MIKRIVKLTFHPEHTEAFISIFEDSKSLIRNFPGCQHVELLRDKNQPTTFFTFSLWDSESKLENYRQSELFQNTWKKTKALFSDKPAAWTVEWLGEGLAK